MDFTETVKKCMADQKVRPSDLAKATGYSVQYIIDLLAGHRRWNETTMSKVSQVLGIKIRFSTDAHTAAPDADQRDQQAVNQ